MAAQRWMDTATTAGRRLRSGAGTEDAWRRPRPVVLVVAIAAVVFALVLCGAQQARADGDDPGGLTLDTIESPAPLSPGSSSAWELGVTTTRVTLESLTLALWSDGPLVQLSNSTYSATPLTASVIACTARWADGTCQGSEWVVVPPVAIGGLAGLGTSLASDSGFVPANVYLRVVVSMPESVGNDTRGLDATITGRVTATGELLTEGDNGSGGAGSGGPDSAGGASGLANTGLWTTGYGALGLAAVCSGLLIAHLRQRRLTASAAPRPSAASRSTGARE